MSRVERHAAEEAASTKKINDAGTGGTSAAGKKKHAVVEEAASTKKHAAEAGGGSSAAGSILVFFGSLIMWAAILLCFVLAAPRLAGIKPYVVISGSMEPAIPVGSLVYSKEADPQTLEPGEVIVFYSSTAAGENSTGDIIPITHRVVENDTDAREITTKGDANEQNDLSAVPYSNVEGRVVFHVPMLGYLGALLSSMRGKVAVALAILAGYLLTEAGGAIKKRS